MQVPCYVNGKDCEKRHPNCHSECPDYQAFWKAKREENARQLRESEIAALRIAQKKKKKIYWQRMKQKRLRGGENYG